MCPRIVQTKLGEKVKLPGGPKGGGKASLKALAKSHDCCYLNKEGKSHLWKGAEFCICACVDAESAAWPSPSEPDACL